MPQQKPIKWKLVTKKVSELKPYSKNPRNITEQGLKDLKKSVDKFGLAELITINTNNIIIGGHARWQTLKANGTKECDCLIPNRKLSDKEVEELNIRLNKNIAGTWDFDILANEFDMGELLEWGFTDKELVSVDFGGGKTDEELDEAPEPQKDAISKLGDIFLLNGKHRVMCGDSTDAGNVALLMDGVKADMVLSDPPYGMDLDTDFSKMTSDNSFASGKKHKKVANDDIQFDATQLVDITDEVVIFGADYYVDTLPNYGKDGSWMIWDKRSSESQDKGFGSCFETIWSKKRHKRWLLRHEWFGFFTGGEKREYEHPTTKPVGLLADILDKVSAGNNIVDLFLGSGSTLIACEQTNRICYGMELDPIYIDVILRRYHTLYPDKEIECLTRKGFNFKKLFTD